MRRRIARRAISRKPILGSRIRARRAAIANKAEELAVQLEELVAEMNDLLGNAKRVVRQAESLPGGKMIAERAYGYWIPALTSYLDPDAAFSTRAMVTPMNTVNELQELADENAAERGRDFFEADEDDF